VKSYREKNNKIVNQWYAQERAAMLAVKTGRMIKESVVTWGVQGDFLYCKLPSGRCLAYFKPSIREGQTSWGETKEQLYITGEKVIETRKVWMEYGIYGGLIVENIVQAICRDLVAEGMKAVTKAGYDVIMHSHDELISEAPKGFGTVEEYERLMCSVPSWAEGFPVKAEGWVGDRYKK
jgi:DNA polymerase